MESSLGSDTTFFAGPSPKHILQGRIHTRPPIHEGGRASDLQNMTPSTPRNAFPHDDTHNNESISAVATNMWATHFCEPSDHIHVDVSVERSPHGPYGTIRFNYSVFFDVIPFDFYGPMVATQRRYDVQHLPANKLVFLTLGVVEPETALGQTGEFCNHTPVRA
uniref:Uncharacterized protein n=1 Tax=Coccidioides posadasii RMSCC 3488 TaxID=454284 RepID=A0A0J6FJV2_COCPO|nr:hypothetical protein CPAG_05436 [Coccidioides posadasii RMSCC 3488]